MNYDIRNKAILKVAGIAVFAAMFCTGCYDLGIEPSVKSPTIETFVDIRDGKEYKKVKIGEQVWMGENLNYAADGSECHKDVIGREYCEEYGRLYDWNTAMNGEHSSSSVPSGVEGVCPVGWHLPSDAEWEALVDYVGEHAGTKLKSETFKGGQPGSVRTPDGTDLYHFSALPGGMRTTHAGQVGYWWTATEPDSDNDKAWFRRMIDNSTGVGRFTFEKHHFLSVRCVHD